MLGSVAPLEKKQKNQGWKTYYKILASGYQITASP